MGQLNHMHLHNNAKRAPELTTVNGQVMSVVYVTAEPTFGGVIGSLSTSAAGSSSRTKQTPTSATAQTSFPAEISDAVTTTDAQPTSTSASAAAITRSVAQSTASNSLTASPTSSAAGSLSLNYNSNTLRVTPPAPTANAQATTGSSAVTTSSNSSQAGMSTGQKAGIAAAVIAVIGLVLVLALLLINRKKKKNKEDRRREDSEKAAMVARQHATMPSSPPTAPRLSLRPASSFLPEFMGGARPKSRLSAGNMLTAITEPKGQGQAAHENSYQMNEKQPMENPFKDPENPFSDPVPSAVVRVSAKPPPTPNMTPALTPTSRPVPDVSVARPASEHIAVAITADGPQISSAGAPVITRKPVAGQVSEMPGSAPDSAPGSLSTGRSETTTPTAMPVPESSVYRVLMDFVPSMDDELELRQGQVVRLLHEYDDGWCLCTRLDRSQQGVVPRTCLASKPSKPRPQPGPAARIVPVSSGMRPLPPSQMRAAPPAGQTRAPTSGRNSPALVANSARLDVPVNVAKQTSAPSSNPTLSDSSRLMSAGAYNQPPRPLSPGPRAQQKRSQSPGPYGAHGRPEMAAAQRRRSNSASAGAQAVRDRRVSPPGPSRLGQESMGVAL